MAAIRSTACSRTSRDDPLWQAAGLMADAPPRPAKGYVVVSAGVAGAGAAGGPHSGPARRGAAALSGMPLRRSNTVALPNGELRKLGVSRQTKYRALSSSCRKSGAVTIGTRNGRSAQVTLLWFP